MSDKYGLAEARRCVEEAENSPRRFARIMAFIFLVWWPTVFLAFWAFGWGVFGK